MAIPPAVPYTRPLKLGSQGKDVIAVKRALSRAGYMEWGDFTPLWGHFAIEAASHFQKDVGLRPGGGYNFNTHEALRHTHRKGHPTEWAFDSTAIKMMEEMALTPEDRARHRIVEFLNWTILNRGHIFYRQYRPMDYHCINFQGEWWADCSEYAKTSYYCAKVKDPDGWGWNGYGSTYSLRQHGQKISLASAQIGDMVFYENPDHVGVLRIRQSGIWYVAEMGSDAGPSNQKANYRPIVELRTYQLV